MAIVYIQSLLSLYNVITRYDVSACCWRQTSWKQTCCWQSYVQKCLTWWPHRCPHSFGHVAERVCCDFGELSLYRRKFQGCLGFCSEDEKSEESGRWRVRRRAGWGEVGDKRGRGGGGRTDEALTERKRSRLNSTVSQHTASSASSSSFPSFILLHPPCIHPPPPPPFLLSMPAEVSAGLPWRRSGCRTSTPRPRTRASGWACSWSPAGSSASSSWASAGSARPCRASRASRPTARWARLPAPSCHRRCCRSRRRTRRCSRCSSSSQVSGSIS